MQHQDLIRITDAGPDADPSQRYGWTLDRDGEPLFRSTEQYDDEAYTREMAAKAVLDGEYRHAVFADAPIAPAGVTATWVSGETTVTVPGKVAQAESLIRQLAAVLEGSGIGTEEARAAWSAANEWLG